MLQPLTDVFGVRTVFLQHETQFDSEKWFLCYFKTVAFSTQFFVFVYYIHQCWNHLFEK